MNIVKPVEDSLEGNSREDKTSSSDNNILSHSDGNEEVIAIDTSDSKSKGEVFTVSETTEILNQTASVTVTGINSSVESQSNDVNSQESVTSSIENISFKDCKFDTKLASEVILKSLRDLESDSMGQTQLLGSLTLYSLISLM